MSESAVYKRNFACLVLARASDLFNARGTGFPSKCPAMCPCKTYNCHGGFQETCGFSEGFCDMLSKPAEYQVNWVRVYQDKNDPKQKVGCSTKERPTRKFIEAHKKKYMQDGDVSF